MAYGVVPLNPGSGGHSIAIDSIGGQDFERTKIAWGAQGTATEVDAPTPLPVRIGRELVGAFTSSTATADAVVLAANSARMSASFFNDADQDFLLAEGFVATTSNFTVRIPAKGLYETTFEGVIHGFFAAAIGGSSLKITEKTPS